MGVVSDPVADMLTRIRNAQMAGHEQVKIPGSNLKRRLAEILVEEGYALGHRFEEDDKQGFVSVTLKYIAKDDPAMTGLRRLSKPGRRVYVNVDEIPKVRNGQGIAILSTSRGVMTDNEARRRRIGGELLCEIW